MRRADPFTRRYCESRGKPTFEYWAKIRWNYPKDHGQPSKRYG